MKTKLCEACKSLGKNNSGHHLDEIFQTQGAPTMIRLCYGHSVELFKMGQTSFISKYRPDVPQRNPSSLDSYDPYKNYFGFNSLR